jgi:hypothetical protein
MTERDDEIAAILHELTAPAAPRDDNPFLKVLNDFAGALNRHDVVEATIEQMAHPKVFSLVTFPKYRRDRPSHMLTFLLDTQKASLVSDLGEMKFTYLTSNELWVALTEFLRNSAFPTTLQQYAEEITQPVEGFLRSGTPAEPSITDAGILVPAVSQQILGSSAVEAQIQLAVEPQPFPFATDYAPVRKYKWLASSGYLMSVDRIVPSGGGLMVEGIAKGVLARYRG